MPGGSTWFRESLASFGERGGIPEGSAAPLSGWSLIERM
jgi:hypothetical protein